jgi:hypothetical protein
MSALSTVSHVTIGTCTFCVALEAATLDTEWTDARNTFCLGSGRRSLGSGRRSLGSGRSMGALGTVSHVTIGTFALCNALEATTLETERTHARNTLCLRSGNE